MATLKEIAQAAGVSMATVSNVINGNHRKVSSDTVEHVQNVIRQMGYVPNQAARSLAQRESRFIAVISQAEKGDNILASPYNAYFIGELTMDLHEKGYYPLIRFTNDFQAIDQDLRGWNVAGAIFNGSFNRYLKQIKALPAIPIVFTDCYCRVPGINHVGVDDEMGGQIAGEYLVNMGHRNIAFVANALEDSEVDQQRLKGFRSSLEAHQTVLHDDLVFSYPSAAEPEALKRLMASSHAPTAFFCTSDKGAMWIYHVLSELSFRIPEDISVVGFDDLPGAKLFNPPLTTIRQDVDQKAHLVVDMLCRHIKDKTLPPERTIIGVNLVERRSVKKQELKAPAKDFTDRF